MLPLADVAVTKTDVDGTWDVASQMPLESSFLESFLEPPDVVPETMSGHFSS